jgi:hypothetical protein
MAAASRWSCQVTVQWPRCRSLGHCDATVVAVLIGGAVLGLLGALVAIPVAAAIDVLVRGTVFPRLDRA